MGKIDVVLLRWTERLVQYGSLEYEWSQVDLATHACVGALISFLSIVLYTMMQDSGNSALYTILLILVFGTFMSDVVRARDACAHAALCTQQRAKNTLEIKHVRLRIVHLLILFAFVLAWPFVGMDSGTYSTCVMGLTFRALCIYLYSVTPYPLDHVMRQIFGQSR